MLSGVVEVDPAAVANGGAVVTNGGDAGPHGGAQRAEKARLSDLSALSLVKGTPTGGAEAASVTGEVVLQGKESGKWNTIKGRLYLQVRIPTIPT